MKVTDGKGGEATQSKTVSVESAIVSLNVPIVASEGGYIEQGGWVNTGGDTFAGDSENVALMIGDRPIRGYVSFNITGLAGATVDEATLTFTLEQLWGDVTAFGSFMVGVVDWGAEPLVLSDFDLIGITIQGFSAAGSPNFTCNAAALKTQLQEAINLDKSRFQLRVYWWPPFSDSDNIWDGWDYGQSGINLSVTYH